MITVCGHVRKRIGACCEVDESNSLPQFLPFISFCNLAFFEFHRVHTPFLCVFTRMSCTRIIWSLRKEGQIMVMNHAN